MEFLIDKILKDYGKGLKSLIHRSHVKAEGENQLHTVAVQLPQTHVSILMPPSQTCAHKHAIIKEKVL